MDVNENEKLVQSRFLVESCYSIFRLSRL